MRREAAFGVVLCVVGIIVGVGNVAWCDGISFQVERTIKLPRDLPKYLEGPKGNGGRYQVTVDKDGSYNLMTGGRWARLDDNGNMTASLDLARWQRNAAPTGAAGQWGYLGSAIAQDGTIWVLEQAVAGANVAFWIVKTDYDGNVSDRIQLQVPAGVPVYRDPYLLADGGVALDGYHSEALSFAADGKLVAVSERQLTDDSHFFAPDGRLYLRKTYMAFNQSYGLLRYSPDFATCETCLFKTTETLWFCVGVRDNGMLYVTYEPVQNRGKYILVYNKSGALQGNLALPGECVGMDGKGRVFVAVGEDSRAQLVVYAPD